MNFVVMKLLLKDQIKEAIGARINEIIDASNWRKAVLPLSLNEIKECKMNKEEVMKEIDIWGDLTKLSLNLWIDYDYYKQFFFKGRHDSDQYEKALRSLGFVFEDGYWVSGSRPMLEDVQTSVSMYCLYLSVHEQMESGMAEENEQIQKKKEEAAQSGRHSRGGVSRPERVESGSDIDERQSDVSNKKADDDDGRARNKDGPSNASSERGQTKKKRNKDIPIMCTFCDNANSGNNEECEICQAELDPYEVQLTAADGDRRVNEPIKSEDSMDKVEVTSNGLIKNGGVTSRSSLSKRDSGNMIEVAPPSRMTNLGDTWACKKCTFNNKSSNETCDACSFSKNEVVRPLQEDHMKEGNEFPPLTSKPKYFVNKFESSENKETKTKQGNKETYNRGRSYQGNVEEGRKGSCGGISQSQSMEEEDDVPQASWRCLHCKKDNPIGTYVCQSCRKYAPFFHKWVCEKCEFFNDKLARQCTRCGNKNLLLKVRQGVVHFDDADHLTEYMPEACPKCRGVLEVPTDGMCRKCMDNKYYCCNNRYCGASNDSKSKYCKTCKLKKGANITDYNEVDVHSGRGYVKMWQCTFCGLFNNKEKCTKCKNLRHSTAYKKCLCKWVNLSFAVQCDNCFQILR